MKRENKTKFDELTPWETTVIEAELEKVDDVTVLTECEPHGVSVRITVDGSPLTGVLSFVEDYGRKNVDMYLFKASNSLFGVKPGFGFMAIGTDLFSVASA